MLDKDPSGLKVLAITINSKVKQAFECIREHASSSCRKGSLCSHQISKDIVIPTLSNPIQSIGNVPKLVEVKF